MMMRVDQAGQRHMRGCVKDRSVRGWRLARRDQFDDPSLPHDDTAWSTFGQNSHGVLDPDRTRLRHGNAFLFRIIAIRKPAPVGAGLARLLQNQTVTEIVLALKAFEFAWT
jgi:hypothetical protein